jgi:hypothetical protein
MPIGPSRKLSPKARNKPFKFVVLVEDLIEQWAEVPACLVGAVMGEEAEHHLAFAFVDVHNLPGEVGHHNRAQVEVVDREMSSFVVVGVVLDLEVEAALHQDGTETLGQGLAVRLGGGWLDSRDLLDLAPAQDHSSRRL